MPKYEITAHAGDYVAGQRVMNLPIIDGKRTITLSKAQADYELLQGTITPIDDPEGVTGVKPDPAKRKGGAA